MLYTITQELKAALIAKGCPIPVLYGPERSGGMTGQRIVLERDRANGDQFTGPRSQQRNPGLVDVRAIGAVLRVYAQSTVAGANVWDHERVADQAIDLITVALRRIVSARKTLWRVGAAKLVSADELDLRGLQSWPGVVYEMRFAIDRGVYDYTWQGAALDEATMGEGGFSIASPTLTMSGSAGTSVPTDLPSATTEIENG